MDDNPEEDKLENINTDAGSRSNTDSLISRFTEQRRITGPSRRADTGQLYPRRNPRAYYREYDEDDWLDEDLTPPRPVRRRPIPQSAVTNEETSADAPSPQSEPQATPPPSPAENQPVSDTLERGGSQLKLINHYRRNVLQQANQSFLLALVAAAIGLVFFIAAVSFLLLKQPQNISNTCLIGGILVEVISGINFFLYGRTSRQLATFHMYLDRTCRFIAVEEACEKITDKEERDRTRSMLLLAYMEIPNRPLDFSKAEKSNNQ